MLLLDDIASKNVLKGEYYNNRRKGTNILKEEEPVRNINKNPQSYRIINIQKKVRL